MDLATFPVDCQNLQICLKPYKLETEKVLLRPRREESAIEHQDSHEWKVRSVQPHVDEAFSYFCFFAHSLRCEPVERSFLTFLGFAHRCSATS
jgi:hypothetical protein